MAPKSILPEHETMAEKKRNRTKEYAKRRQERALDKIAEFEEFNATLAPKLRALLKAGASSDELLKFGEAFAAARVVSIAATESDSSKALAASKDILDRTRGKAKETVETTHKFDNLDEQQLDALVLSKLKEAEVVEADDQEASDASSNPKVN